jgi:hypothetical protein
MTGKLRMTRMPDLPVGRMTAIGTFGPDRRLTMSVLEGQADFPVAGPDF